VLTHGTWSLCGTECIAHSHHSRSHMYICTYAHSIDNLLSVKFCVQGLLASHIVLGVKSRLVPGVGQSKCLQIFHMECWKCIFYIDLWTLALWIFDIIDLRWLVTRRPELLVQTPSNLPLLLQLLKILAEYFLCLSVGGCAYLESMASQTFANQSSPETLCVSPIRGPMHHLHPISNGMCKNS